MTKPELARLGRHISLLIFCCSAALSIVVTQIALGLYLVFWLYETAPQLFLRLRDPHTRLFEPFFQMYGTYFIPASIWIGVCFLTACTGIDPARSLEESGKLALSLLFPMLVAFDNAATRESARENVESFGHIACASSEAKLLRQCTHSMRATIIESSI